MKAFDDHRYRRLVVTLLAAWFALALAASALMVFQAGSRTSFAAPLPLGLAALLPIVAFLTWFVASAGFRRFALSLNPRTLTMVQAWRIGGFVFLVLAAHGILPKAFALPAGWGDIAVGATAPLAALYLAKPEHRRGFIVWQVLGTLDLVMAVTLGVLASPGVRVLGNGVTTEAMSVLPLSLIPTFAVPLLLIFHIICTAQAAGWERSASAAKAALHLQPATRA